MAARAVEWFESNLHPDLRAICLHLQYPLALMFTGHLEAGSSSSVEEAVRSNQDATRATVAVRDTSPGYARRDLGNRGPLGHFRTSRGRAIGSRGRPRMQTTDRGAGCIGQRRDCGPTRRDLRGRCCLLQGSVSRGSSDLRDLSTAIHTSSPSGTTPSSRRSCGRRG